MPQTYTSHSLHDLPGIVQSLLDTWSQERIFAFYGKMGAGKTTFIKEFCRHLGVETIVNSPTFAIVNEYLAANGQSVYHFDLYRLERWEEMLDIGYEDYFFSNNYCLVEWPEKIENLLPDDHVKVMIETDPNSETRYFTF
jgi:tRNA threonylcarbamoyladenosine biosynthesis protein TsaE